jgi:hypothetical protein
MHVGAVTSLTCCPTVPCQLLVALRPLLLLRLLVLLLLLQVRQEAWWVYPDC